MPQYGVKILGSGVSRNSNFVYGSKGSAKDTIRVEKRKWPDFIVDNK